MKILNLGNNKIKEIKVFECVNFKYLIDLDLSSNLITDISVFKNISFTNLKYLKLYENNIQSEINKQTIEKLNETIENLEL